VADQLPLNHDLDRGGAGVVLGGGLGDALGGLELLALSAAV